MRRRSQFSLPLLAALAALTPGLVRAQARAPDPTGLWLTEGGGAAIRIETCGAVLCGSVVATGNPKHCHLTIMNVAPRDDGAWWGEITNPRDGSVWNVRVTLDDADHLRLRGYVLVPALGESQIWTRYTGRLTPDCQLG